MKTVVLLVLIATLGVSGQINRARWVQAERKIRRVAPQSYQKPPRTVARYLRRHGYTIPQSYAIGEQHNAVSGHFDADALPDWAVLASRSGTSRILVFWGGSTARVTALAPQADSGYLQTISKVEIGYSRVIAVVGRNYILEHYRRYGGPKPPAILHDAIDDGFAEKASMVYYFDGRRWHELQGAA